MLLHVRHVTTSAVLSAAGGMFPIRGRGVAYGALTAAARPLGVANLGSENCYTFFANLLHYPAPLEFSSPCVRIQRWAWAGCTYGGFRVFYYCCYSQICSAVAQCQSNGSLTILVLFSGVSSPCLADHRFRIARHLLVGMSSHHQHHDLHNLHHHHHHHHHPPLCCSRTQSATHPVFLGRRLLTCKEKANAELAACMTAGKGLQELFATWEPLGGLVRGNFCHLHCFIGCCLSVCRSNMI